MDATNELQHRIDKAKDLIRAMAKTADSTETLLAMSIILAALR